MHIYTLENYFNATISHGHLFRFFNSMGIFNVFSKLQIFHLYFSSTHLYNVEKAV